MLTKKSYKLIISHRTREALNKKSHDRLYSTRLDARTDAASGRTVTPNLTRVLRVKYWQTGLIHRPENLLLREPIYHLFHNNYTDNRPQYLIQARSWSVAERRFATSVKLAPYQVAQVLQLALEHDINFDFDPEIEGLSSRAYMHKIPLTYILSTFLEAVISEHLTSTLSIQPATTNYP